MNCKLEGGEMLERKLKALNKFRFDAVVKATTIQLFNYMKNNTPVDSGELRQSLITQKDIVGYTKSYAPHVEYGYRKIGGGWVNGQFYLKKGVEHQRKIYKDTLLKQIKKEGG